MALTYKPLRLPVWADGDRKVRPLVATRRVATLSVPARPVRLVVRPRVGGVVVARPAQP